MLDDPEYPGRDPAPNGEDPLDVEYLRCRADAMPKDWACWFRLGFRLLELGDATGAVAALRRAVALAQWNGLARYFLGKALASSGQEKEATLTLKDATRLRPGLVEAWHLLACALSDQGAYADAVHAWQHVARAAPDGEVYWQLGYCLAVVGREREAIVALEEAVRLQPNHLPAHHALAVLGKIQGEPDLTARHRRRLFELNEDWARKLDDELER